MTGTGKSHSYAFLSVQCFLLYSCAFSAITIPMGGTPAIKQEASKEMVLYALAMCVCVTECVFVIVCVCDCVSVSVCVYVCVRVCVCDCVFV